MTFEQLGLVKQLIYFILHMSKISKNHLVPPIIVALLCSPLLLAIAPRIPIPTIARIGPFHSQIIKSWSVT